MGLPFSVSGHAKGGHLFPLLSSISSRERKKNRSGREGRDS